MSRRRDEQAFGSDSFLDIVANVVGILIILIIVAGVRVSRMPVLAIAPPAAVETPPAPPPAPPPVEPQPVFEPEPEPYVAPLIIDEPPPAPPQPQVIVVERPLPELSQPEAPAGLVAKSEDLRRAIDDLTATRLRIEQELATAAQRVAQTKSNLQQRQADASAAQQAAEAKAAREREELAAGNRDLLAICDQLARLKEMLADADEEPAATPIQHRVTPIGRAVTGQELHFHLSQGRVAYVPIDELARRLRAQIERQKELYAKMERYEGSVDPIDGFRMKYVIQRSRLSLQEELKYGQGIIRMQVSQWVLTPEPGLATESADEALQRGSKFYQALLTAGPTATLTFWVYPDSFELCGQLKAFAQQHGYDVAARPLPWGVPIAGSPDGSKSIAQ